MITTTSEDGTAKIWDLQTGFCVLTLRGHTDTVNSAKFNKNGSLLVTASKDGFVRVWDAKTGRCIHILKTYSEEYWSFNFELLSAAFSASGDHIIASSKDKKEARIWNISTLVTFHEYFCAKEDTITLPQAFVLCEIFKKIEERKHNEDNQDLFFDFRNCKHLEEEYDALFKYYIDNKICTKETRDTVHRILEPFIVRCPTLYSTLKQSALNSMALLGGILDNG